MSPPARTVGRMAARGRGAAARWAGVGLLVALLVALPSVWSLLVEPGATELLP